MLSPPLWAWLTLVMLGCAVVAAPSPPVRVSVGVGSLLAAGVAEPALAVDASAADELVEDFAALLPVEVLLPVCVALEPGSVGLAAMVLRSFVLGHRVMTSSPWKMMPSSVLEPTMTPGHMVLRVPESAASDCMHAVEQAAPSWNSLRSQFGMTLL
jgi:hypothetical protein